jgi:hypothetical protein
MLANWIHQLVISSGTGDIFLGIALDSYIAVGSAYNNNDEIHYSIIDGINRENGLGTYISSSNSIVRNQVFETLTDSIYQEFPITPLSLTTSAIVSVTPSTRGLITNKIIWKNNNATQLLNSEAWPIIPPMRTLINGIMVPAFSPDAEESINISFKIGHDIAKDNSMYPHIAWSPLSANIGTVRWGVEYSLAVRETGAFVASTLIYTQQITTGIIGTHQYTEFPDLNKIPSAPPNTIIMGRVFRDSNHEEDTFTGSAGLHSVTLHYPSTFQGTPNKDPDYYTWT